MSEKIGSALTDIEWEEVSAGLWPLDARVGAELVSLPQAIAIANAALPDTDPRKITRDWVIALRAEAERGRRADVRGDNAGFSAIDPDTADQIANALESYLPPESQ